VARAIKPHFVIINAGVGSQFDPFFTGGSEIQSIYEDVNSKTRIIREYDLITDPTPNPSPALDRTLTFDEFGTYGIGLVGLQNQNINTNNFFFKFNSDSPKYTDTFYETTAGDADSDYKVTSKYTSTEPSFPTPILRRVVKEIINDTLRAKYYRKGFTWWDLLRRLTLDEVGDMLGKLQSSIWRDLGNGKFNGGEKIHVSLNSDDEITGIITTKPASDDESSEFTSTEPGDIEDTTYVTDDDRINTNATGD